MSIASTPNLYRSNFGGGGGGGGSNTMTDHSLHLPKIVHPSSRIENPNSLNVTARAVSVASSLGNLAEKLNSNSFYDEHGESTFKRNRNLNRSFESDINIPENVRAIYTPDVNKVSLPIFGGRPQTSGSDASYTGRNSVSLSSRVDITEYFNILKEKLKSNHRELKNKFRNADQEGKGGVSKEAFAHILASILGPTKPLSHHHFVKLLERMGLKNRTAIKFEDFLNCFQENKSESADWIDPIRSNNTFQTEIVRKANQVFVILKEKANMRTSDITGLIPQLTGGPENKIFKGELLSTIKGMGIKMEQEEFEKLWKKFDAQNNGLVSSAAFLKKLGIAIESSLDDSFNEASTSDINDDLSVPHIPNAREYLNKPSTNKYTVKSPKKSSNKNPIEKWLKKRFRDGFSKLKSSFEELDLQKTGQVRRDQFLNVLRQHGLALEENLLDSFLERCNIKLAKNSILITYTDFLEKFQNRSDQGLAYKAIANGDISDDSSVSIVGQVERRLIKMFQNDFLALLQIFRKIDRNKTNTISKQEFRAAIESNFAIELTDNEFDDFVKFIPRDGNNRIKYLEFMTRFDSDSSSSLFDSESVYQQEEFKPKKTRKYEPIIEENEDVNTPRANKENGRPVHQLSDIVKELIRTNYKEVEKAWSEVDALNSNEMSKDMMWNLFKKLKITPPITRDEIETLWKEFILKDNKKLEYWQFVRHFGYTKKSAAYIDSKRAPPKRGDNDMMLTSNKLGRDSILIRGSVQSKLILQFDVLKRTFIEMDPYFTNYLLREEFEEILLELCPELNKQELDYICSKHQNPNDGRINYMDFLTPYGPKRNREIPNDTFRAEGSVSSRLDANDTLIIKLRMKLSDNFKEIRRSFKQHDYKQTGLISISAFKDILKGTRVNLNEDDMYTLLRRLDKDVTGMVNYSKFIEILKN